MVGIVLNPSGSCDHFIIGCSIGFTIAIASSTIIGVWCFWQILSASFSASWRVEWQTAGLWSPCLYIIQNLCS